MEFLRLCRLVAATMLLAAPAAIVLSQTGGDDRALLNSERIARSYGNYGVEILESGEVIRVSSLFSESQGLRTTRTFAVVLFHAGVGVYLEEEHRAVLDGGSIGETLSSHGWVIRKSDRYFGFLPSTDRVEQLMRLDAPNMLAAHVYDLYADGNGISHAYATIVEIHHPDYLELHELGEIYGFAGASKGAEGALALTWEKMN